MNKSCVISLFAVVMFFLQGCSLSNVQSEISQNTDRVKPSFARQNNLQDTMQVSAGSFKFDVPKITHDPVIELPGSASSYSEVYVNGSKQTVDKNGNFTAILTLEEGKNVIELKAVRKGKESSSIYRTGKTVEFIPNKEKPQLSVDLQNSYSYRHIIFQGQTDPGSLLKVNNISVTVNGDGSFLSELYLSQGNHIVTITAENNEGLCTVIQKEVNVTYPTKKPKLIVSLPNEPGFLTSDQLILNGYTDPYNIVEVYNNYQSKDKDVLSLLQTAEVTNGRFRCRINLSPGRNQLLIRAVDPAGNTCEEERNIEYKSL